MENFQISKSKHDSGFFHYKILNENSQYIAKNNTLSYTDNPTNISQNQFLNNQLTPKELQEIIVTRLIVSSIGAALCIICIVLYIMIFIKKRCLSNNKEDDKIIDIEKLDNLNTFDENLLNNQEEGNDIFYNMNNEERISLPNNLQDRTSSKNFNDTGEYFQQSNFNSNSEEESDKTENNNNNHRIYYLPKTSDNSSKHDESKIPSVSPVDLQRKTLNDLAGENSKIDYPDLSNKINNDRCNNRLSEFDIKIFQTNIRPSNDTSDIAQKAEVNINDLKTHVSYEENSNILTTANNINNLNLDNGNNKVSLNTQNEEKNTIVASYVSFKGLEKINSERYHSKTLKVENVNKSITSEIEVDSNKNSINIREDLQSNDSSHIYLRSQINFSQKNCHSNKYVPRLYSHSKNDSKYSLSSPNEFKNVCSYTNINSKNIAITSYKESYVTNNSKKNETILAQVDSEHLRYTTQPNCFEDNYSIDDSVNSVSNLVSGRRSKPKELKMGMINDISFMLILSNLGFLSSTFFILDSSHLNRDNPLCKAQGMIQNYFDLASICWTTVISNVMKNLTLSIKIELEKRKLVWYFLYSLVVPFLFGLGPAITTSYGPSGPWCWIENKDENKMDIDDLWIYVMYAFMWSNILVISLHFYKILCYFKLRLREIRNQNKEEEKKFLQKNILILYCFPLILIIVKSPATLNRVAAIFFKFHSVLLFHLQAAFSPMIGVLNSFVFFHIHIKFLKNKNLGSSKLNKKILKSKNSDL